MDETDFDPERSPGDFVTVGDALLFDPDPLPPELTATHDLVDACGRTMHALGRLADLPVDAPEVLVAPLVHRAAVEATGVDGDDVDLADLFLGTAGDRAAGTGDDRGADTGDDRAPGTGDDRAADSGDDRGADIGDDRAADSGDDRDSGTSDDRSPETSDDGVTDTGDDRDSGTSDDRSPEPTDDETVAPVAEAANYLRAVEAGIAAVDSGRRLDGALVRELHDRVVTGARTSGGEPGEYRTRAVEIGGDDPDLVATPASNVPFRMRMLFEYVRDGGRYAPPVEVALLRYQFLTLHPFLDGNGRTSRVLTTLELYRQGLVPGPYLYPTAWVETNRREFRERILDVSRYGSWNEWVAFVLSGLRSQATTVHRTARALGSLRDRYRERYRGDGPVTADLIDHLVAHPYTSPELAVGDVDRPRSTVAAAFDVLESDDVVETDPLEAMGDDAVGGTGDDVVEAAGRVRVPDVLAVVRTHSASFGEDVGD